MRPIFLWYTYLPMTKKEETIATYEKSAEALAEKFDAIGPRIDDIDYVFRMCNKQNPVVLEIGCGNGRDAKAILTHTNNYTGIDISKNLLQLAQENVPQAIFQLADVENYKFPTHLDIVFAFASFIHSDKANLASIMRKLFNSLNEDGLVFISLKYSPVYEEVTKTDKFGTRTYYHYSQQETETLTGGLTPIHTSIKELAGQIWIDVLYQKIS